MTDDDLIRRLETGNGGDRELDARLWCLDGREYRALDQVIVIYTTPKGGLAQKALSEIPLYTSSLDAAISLVEMMLPGCWYLIGKGKMKAAEPLYGAQIKFGSDETLGEGECDGSLARATLIALLRALSPPAIRTGKEE